MSERRSGSLWLDFYSYKRRVVYSLLRAAVRTATRLSLSLDDLSELLQMAFFEEKRIRDGETLQEIAKSARKSMRSISTLHKRFQGDFFAPEREVALRRQIAVLLDGRRATLKEIAQEFSSRRPRDVEAAVEDLVRQGKIIQIKRHYVRNPENQSFFSETDAQAKIDGLNRIMDILSSLAWHRLVQDDDEAANGRSFVFHADPSELQRLVSEWIDSLRTRAAELNEQNQDKPRYGLTLAIAPVAHDEEGP